MNKEAVRFFEDKLKFEIDPYSVRHIVDAKDDKYAIVDVRDNKSFSTGHVPGAINVSGHDIDKYDFPKDKILVFYCYHDVCFAAPKAALLCGRRLFP